MKEAGTARAPTASPDLCNCVFTAAAAETTAELHFVTIGSAEAAVGMPPTTAAAAAAVAPRGLVPTLLLPGDCLAVPLAPPAL